MRAARAPIVAGPPVVLLGTMIALTLVVTGCREHGAKPAEPAETAETTTPTETAAAVETTKAATAPSTVAQANQGAGPPPAMTASTDAVAPSPARELTWRWKDSPVGPMVVVVSVPETARRLPVLVAMHGLGESEKGPERGSRGWLDDYHLGTALGRVKAPPLTDADYQRLGGEARRAELNALLEAHPYEGLILVMPYTPNILAPDRSLDGAEDLGRFLVDELLPRVRAETPARSGPESTGIDGVSLGGRASLLVGLAHPDQFGVVASLQAAVYPPEIDELVARVKKARAQNPNQQLRLLTSRGDFYRGTLGELSRALTKQHLVHHFISVEGPHDYAFNRGPGVYEMLLFHDRALRTPLRQ